MNIHTFQDAVASRRQTLADQFIDDDDDEVEKADAKKVVEGEEEEDGSGGKVRVFPYFAHFCTNSLKFFLL